MIESIGLTRSLRFASLCLLLAHRRPITRPCCCRCCCRCRRRCPCLSLSLPTLTIHRRLFLPGAPTPAPHHICTATTCRHHPTGVRPGRARLPSWLLTSLTLTHPSPLPRPRAPRAREPAATTRPTMPHPSAALPHAGKSETRGPPNERTPKAPSPRSPATPRPSRQYPPSRMSSPS